MGANSEFLGGGEAGGGGGPSFSRFGYARDVEYFISITFGITFLLRYVIDSV